MDRQAVTQDSFWEIEAEPVVPVRDTVVTRISASEVDAFCREFHYAKAGGNMMWRWGLWGGHVLLGVIAYNLPTRDTCASVFGPEHLDKVWHMGRLVMHDDAPKNSESRLIGASLREMAREYPETWAVITYADTGQGHIGTVYQATNALYTGIGGVSTIYRDRNGTRRGDFFDGKGVTRERAQTMGWRRIGKSPGKHRYVYVLGDRRQRRERMKLLRLPVLPYPKAPESAAVNPPGGAL